MPKIEIFGVPYLKKGSGIHIKKKNRGKFTEYCGGEVTDECIQKAKKSKNPTLRKRATFAQNARRWKHKEGGELERESKKKLIKGETGFVNKRPIPGLPSNATSKKKQKAEEGAKIHKPNGHKSILDNGWQSTKELKKKNRPLISINATGGPLENPSRNWDKTLTGKLINFSENPDSIGWDAKNRRWYAPPAGKGYDTNQFGMGVDRNQTPGFKERVKRDNKGREYLTADDERYLRHKAIDRANESANTRYKFAQKASKIKGAVSPKHDAITVSAIYNLGPGHMARTVFENSKAMKSIFNRNSPEYQNHIHKQYKLKGRNERIQNELKFFKQNGL